MTEKRIHKQIVDYLRFQYPKAIFTTDMSGIKLSIGQAVQASKLRSERGIPDILIFETNNKFCGLFLEVKKTSPFLKNGNLSTDKHIQEQAIMHEKLTKKGYFVKFVWSLEQAIIIIDKYLKM